MAVVNGKNGHSTQQENGFLDTDSTNLMKDSAAQNRVERLTVQQKKDERTIEHYTQIMKFGMRRLHSLGCEKLMMLIQQITDMRHDIRQEELYYTEVLRANGNQRTDEVMELLESKKENMENYLIALEFRNTLREILESRHDTVNAGGGNGRTQFTEEEGFREAEKISHYGDLSNIGVEVLKYLSVEKIISLMNEIPDCKPHVIASEKAYVEALRMNDNIRCRKVLGLLERKTAYLQLYRSNKRIHAMLQKAGLDRIECRAPPGSRNSAPAFEHAGETNQQKKDISKVVNKKAEAFSQSVHVNHSPTTPASPMHKPELVIKSLESSAVRSALPIDDHREEILKLISRDRVTMIQGETGCGKSSRLPVMLLEDAKGRGIPCRIMVSNLFRHITHLPSTSLRMPAYHPDHSYFTWTTGVPTSAHSSKFVNETSAPLPGHESWLAHG